MSPKYRGDSDDWLDNEELPQKRSANVRNKKAAAARSLGLSLEEANAVVAAVFPNQCRVIMDDGGEDLLCSYRRAEVVGKAKREYRERSPVAVGDRVWVKRTGSSSGLIEGICSRRNSLSRLAPGRESEIFQHVLAANIDFLVIVASTHRPEFSPGLVDRFLIAAEVEQIPVLICVTKIDLAEPSETPWRVYGELGYDVLEVSSKMNVGISQLLAKIEGKTVVFCGQSGVGKTSLLRVLLGSDVGRVEKVNELTGKGRHTTTGAVLLGGGPHHSKWIDTPGVREFGLLKVSPENLAHWFPEFKNLRCAQQSCLHQNEEGCAAQSLSRYPSYRRIFDSLRTGKY